VEFDTFVSTHGPWTSVEDPDYVGKRKLVGIHDPRQRSKHPAYFIPELAHVVAMCDERIPFLSMAQELTRREIAHQGIQVTISILFLWVSHYLCFIKNLKIVFDVK